MLFLSKRFSSVRSATASLRAAASCRSSLTSGLVACRAVSPDASFQPRGTPFRDIAAQCPVGRRLRPAVIQARRDPLASAGLGNAVFAAQALKDEPDLLLGGLMLPGPPSDVLHDLLGRFIACSASSGKRPTGVFPDPPPSVSSPLPGGDDEPKTSVIGRWDARFSVPEGACFCP